MEWCASRMKDSSAVFTSLSTLESLAAELHSIEWPRGELLAEARREAAAEQALATQAQRVLETQVAVLLQELSVSEVAVSDMARAAKLAGGQLDWAQEELERMEAELEGAHAQVGGLREQLASLVTERAQVETFQQQIMEQAERDVQAARAGAAAAVADAEKKLQEARQEAQSTSAAASRAEDVAQAEGPATRTAQVEALGLEAQLAALRRHASELEAELRRKDEELHALKSVSPVGRAETEARREAEALAQDLFARERESLRAAAAEIAGRETRLLDSQESLAAELAELQGLLAGQEPYGEALVRLSQERQQAHGELGPAKRRVRELEEETMRLRADCDRLRARNATLLERERRRRQALNH